MLACARRALVVLVTAAAAMTVLAPATNAFEPPPTAVTRSNLSLDPHQRTIHYAHSVRLAAQLRGVMGPLINQRVSF